MIAAVSSSEYRRRLVIASTGQRISDQAGAVNNYFVALQLLLRYIAPMKKSEIITIKQAAEMLGLCVDSVRKYCQKGRIAGATVISGAWAIPLKSLKNGIEKKKPGRKRKEKAND